MRLLEIRENKSTINLLFLSELSLCAQWNRPLPHSSVQSSKAKQDKFPLVHRYPRATNTLLTSFSSPISHNVHKHVRKVAAALNKPALFSHISSVIVHVLVVCQPAESVCCVCGRYYCNSAIHHRAPATPPRNANVTAAANAESRWTRTGVAQVVRYRLRLLAPIRPSIDSLWTHLYI